MKVEDFASPQWGPDVPWYDRPWYVEVDVPVPAIRGGVCSEYRVRATVAPGERLDLVLFGTMIKWKKMPPPKPFSSIRSQGEMLTLATVFFGACEQPETYTTMWPLSMTADADGLIDQTFRVPAAAGYALSRYEIFQIQCISSGEGEIEIFEDGHALFWKPAELYMFREHTEYRERTWRQVLEDRCELWLDTLEDEHES